MKTHHYRFRLGNGMALHLAVTAKTEELAWSVALRRAGRFGKLGHTIHQVPW